jgi:glycosyltransferase involved in cell wall biosynthesis
MGSPVVSIIIPCYRNANVLPEAVDSALAQTYQPMEIIVVNDGSDDETDEVAARYAGRIRYIHKANGGRASARNAGLHQAKGDFVLFLDADDMLHPQALAWLVEATEGQSDRIALVGYQRFTRHPQIDGEESTLPPETASFFPWVIHRSYALHGFLCPRPVAIGIGGFDKTMFLEDWDFWARIALHGARLATVRHVGAFYRRSPGSVTSDRGRLRDGPAQVLLKLYEHVRHDAEFLTLWGPDVLRALYGVRRRLIASGTASPHRRGLDRAIRSLRHRGVRVKEPMLVNVQARMPMPVGNLIERAGLQYFRWFRPNVFAGIIE